MASGIVRKQIDVLAFLSSVVWKNELPEEKPSASNAWTAAAETRRRSDEMSEQWCSRDVERDMESATTMEPPPAMVTPA